MDVSAGFRVVRLTRVELKEQTNRDDFEQWGAPELDLAQYERLELRKRRTKHSQSNSVTWALVQRGQAAVVGDDSDAGLKAGGDLLACHCECYWLDCVLRRRSGEIVTGSSFHVGSVFTLPAFRKKGLAAFFLEQVVDRMAKLRRNAVASILYSDIGPTYYDRLGWRLYPSLVATLSLDDPKNSRATAGSAASGSKLEELFLDDNLSELLVADNDQLVKQLSGEEFAGQEAFVVLPTRDSIEWLFCVGVHYAEILGFDEAPTQCGANIPEAGAFVVWSHDLKESKLDIVRYRFGSNQETARLLLIAALNEARKFRLSKVAIWSPPEILLSDGILHKLHITFSEREDSLSSAMIIGEHRSDSAPAVWLANEKYSWV